MTTATKEHEGGGEKNKEILLAVKKTVLGWSVSGNSDPEWKTEDKEKG